MSILETQYFSNDHQTFIVQLANGKWQAGRAGYALENDEAEYDSAQEAGEAARLDQAEIDECMLGNGIEVEG